MAATWYVYHLVDPRTGAPFYVGKGKGQRIGEHEKEAKKGVTSPKCNKIREIWDADLPIERRILKLFDLEAAAYRFEAEEIKRIGLENLTNLSEGTGLPKPWTGKPLVLTEDQISRLAWLIHTTSGLTREFQITATGPLAAFCNGMDAALRKLGGYIPFTKHLIELFGRACGYPALAERLKPYGVSLVDSSAS